MHPEDRLEELLDQWEDSREKGTPVSPEELCRDAPELLDELKRRVKNLDAFDRFLCATVVNAEGADSDDSLPVMQPGRYRPMRRYARGGMGDVYVAHDDELNREVALKGLQSIWAESREARARFLLEAEVTSRLQHPGIVPIYGLGQDERGRTYYAMRLVEGQTLDQACEEFHAVDGPDREPGERAKAQQKLLLAFLHVCETVEYAHNGGVLHRDIKPGNIKLGKFGEVVLLDWGLAKVTHDGEPNTVKVAVGYLPLVSTDKLADTEVAQAGRTRLGEAKGTPGYMSPEQAAGNWERVGPASDVFGLGATFYKLLTGRRPFGGETVEEMLSNVRGKAVTPPRQIKPLVPRALEAICLRAMHMDPQNRYPSARALADDIENWLADKPVSAWREPWDIRARRWLRRHRTVVTAGITTTLAVVVLLSGFVIRLHTEKLKLETANLQLWKSQIEEKAAREEAEESQRQEKAARDEAEKNLQLAALQLLKLIEPINRPDTVVAYHGHPLFDFIVRHCETQFEDLAQRAPRNDFGDFVGIMLESMKITRAFLNVIDDQSSIQEARDQLATLRDNLQCYLKNHSRDDDEIRLTVEAELARVDLVEALLLSEREAEDARRVLRRAFERLDAIARPEWTIGIRAAFQAASAAGGLISLDRDPVVIRDWAARALAVLARFENVPQRNDAVHGDDEAMYLLCVAKTEVLAQVAQLFLIFNRVTASKELRDESRRAAEAALEAAGKCPPARNKDPFLSSWVGIARRCLGEVSLYEKEYQNAWIQLRDAQVRLNATGLRESVIAIETQERLIEAGVNHLRSADRTSPAARRELQAVASETHELVTQILNRGTPTGEGKVELEQLRNELKNHFDELRN
jgi:serine/threonine protein kinase